MKTTIHGLPKTHARSKQPELVEIELNEEDLPYFEHASEGAHVATVTIRRKGKAARFFLRVSVVDDFPSAQIIGLRRENNNMYKEVDGEWNRQLECAIARNEQAGVGA